MAEDRFWLLMHPDTIALPDADSIIGYDQPGQRQRPLIPIVDEEYGGVIAWANTEEQGNRIVNALKDYYDA